MSWWTPAWPTLPAFDFSLPTDIQRRFLSYVLKRALGRFVKPGQFNVQQIDSQVGSGYFQVRDLEIDHDGVNGLLSGLPVELQDGTVGSISARIPWSNPIGGNIELSLSSLHLTLKLVASVDDVPVSPVDLANSVANFAEEFVHNELSAGEEDALRQSIHSELDPVDFPSNSTGIVPGGLDPFEQSGERQHISSDKQTSDDPAGISLFATLFERLLLRFEMNVVDTRITLVHPGHAAYTVTLSELLFSKEPSDARAPGTVREEMRVMRMSGFSVSCCNLDPSALHFHRPPVGAPGLRTARTSTLSTDIQLSPPHSDSDIDEASEALMSQSLAALPPRSHVQLDADADVESSVLFQSALSLLPEISDSGNEDADKVTPSMHGRHSSSEIDMPGPDSVHETLLSLDAEPLVVHISLSFPSNFSPRSDSYTPDNLTTGHPSSSTNGGRAATISITCGILAFALRPWLVSALAELVDAFASHAGSSSGAPPPDAPKQGSITSHSLLHEVEISVRTRGLLFLLLSSANSTDDTRNFFSQPLATPSLRGSFVRVFADTVKCDVSLAAAEVHPTPTQRSSQAHRTRGTSTFSCFRARLSVYDISLLGFVPDVLSYKEAYRVFPILITDSHLPSQYAAEHNPPPSLSEASVRAERTSPPDLPEFYYVDWLSPSTRTDHPKLSMWRTKPPSRARHARPSSVDTVVASPSLPQSASPGPGREPSLPHGLGPAISVQFNSPSSQESGTGPPLSVCADLAPLRLLLDFRTLLGRTGDDTQPSTALQFVCDVTERMERLLPVSMPRAKGTRLIIIMSDGGNTAPLTEKGHEEIEKLERLLFDDLDLSTDYRSYETGARPGPSLKPPVVKTTIRLPMTRFELRNSCDESRFSTVVLDIHDVVLRLSSKTSDNAHSTPQPHPSAAPVSSKDNLIVEIGRLVAAVSQSQQDVICAFASVGSLAARSPTTSSHTSCHAQLTLSSVSGRDAAAATVVALDVPSVYVNVSKHALDSLQMWADGVSKLTEHALASPADDGAASGSKAPSIIGSRFFLEQRRASQDSPTERETVGTSGSGQTIFKVTIAEVYARLQLDRLNGSDARVVPFDILASDSDILLEMKPDGKARNHPFCLPPAYTLRLGRNCVHSFGSRPGCYRSCQLMSQHRRMVQLRFASSVVAGSLAKESRVDVTLSGFTFNFFPDIQWALALAEFVKAPPGVFEGVPPSEQTVVEARIREGAIRLFAPAHPGAFIVHLGELDLFTALTSDSSNLGCRVSVPSLNTLFTDDFSSLSERLLSKDTRPYRGLKYWKKSYYTLIAEFFNATVLVDRFIGPPSKHDVSVEGANVLLHLCADTGTALGAFFGDFLRIFAGELTEPVPGSKTLQYERAPADVSTERRKSDTLMSLVDEGAFRAVPEVGPPPDMVSDDLPVNMDYLDESYGAAAGLREIDDSDLDDFGDTYTPDVDETDPHIISRVGGETIRLLQLDGLSIAENHFNSLPVIAEEIPHARNATHTFRLHKGELTLLLYDGYDLTSTRRTIELEVKEMKKRLAKIRQLVAEGQKYDPIADETSTLLFNSIYVGLQDDAADMEPDVLIAAIDEELREDLDPETATQSSWQSLKPQQTRKLPTPASTAPRSGRTRRLTRASTPSIEFKLQGVSAVYDQYAPQEDLSSRIFVTIRDAEILDHIKTSTWRKFLAALRSDSRGNVRETGSNMVRIELQNIRPVPEHTSEEVRLRAKLLPLRLHVDQDALDFLKKFFMFKDPNASVVPPSPPVEEAYIQRAEVFPVGIKLDYKPRRVDYRALRDGRTIELMNFFHFDGAEMTLRHVTVNGVTGWARFFDMLNDIWTPDVKATQLADMISGVAPIRSVVNVGSGVADLVLLPIAQYRKDGRLIRGVQKGAKAFVKSTAVEAVKLGARLATGTQVILERTENILGSQFNETETVMVREDFDLNTSEDSVGEQVTDPISRYAEQPVDMKEGIQTAYASMRRNLNSAAQTILAVPMEVYERSGNGGAVRAVIRAVPIAVLKPMIGASEAVSKALLGLQNTMDPNVRLENDAKYKRRT
ncbi:hypothetical protein K488DRAFT_42229 [Vararia minispora EC-137]|uniref:Uncharacterized protein n=1 Tax=Vararia minispora EC-137 TaxID=1314806 RepID=A0ACB8QVN4_9AGAM|nr:hypothetical protein K488DRAFT_42229 [Vararia minispora EC-137]